MLDTCVGGVLGTRGDALDTHADVVDTSVGLLGTWHTLRGVCKRKPFVKPEVGVQEPELLTRSNDGASSSPRP